ncbi:hypothetical protein C8Q76DRAFT_800971 [Earliella scabrosa]|nr:hypothetical protein C8Q76DRAFT_800971 [Earliella scabrosa]
MPSTRATPQTFPIPYVWQSAPDAEGDRSQFLLRLSVAPIVVRNAILHVHTILEVQGGGDYGAIVLPTWDFGHLQESGAHVWREFWRKIEEGRAYVMMTQGQIRTVRSTLDFFAWAVEHPDQVEPLWEGFRQYLEMAGTVSSLQRALGDPFPPEIVLHCFLSEVETHFSELPAGPWPGDEGQASRNDTRREVYSEEHHNEDV